MELLLLSDLATMNGIKIRTSDCLIPKEYTGEMLYAFPATLVEVEEFFKEHCNAKAVVIRGGLK